ncbi:hypothetical protein SAMN04488116_3158 [Flagellimonas flava]|uniref:Uncharacterized protein n=1 Tax=Flagellimonas flava TaxID=570519 RepID=A0A1M5PD08_9FLAO|nr:hypothetical protein SAMN04488116_3158 [Allomuricauda flava]
MDKVVNREFTQEGPQKSIGVLIFILFQYVFYKVLLKRPTDGNSNTS